MIFRTASRRIEVDTDSGFFLRLPLFGEVFYSRETGWVQSRPQDEEQQTEASSRRVAGASRGASGEQPGTPFE